MDSSLHAEQIEKLHTMAREVSERAYAPYSKFHVGAAVLDERGQFFQGCNVENASYGLTICAERFAVGRAVAEGASMIEAVGIYTPTESLTYPCGACRQVLHEFGPKMEIHLFNQSGQHLCVRLDEIFGCGFDLTPES